MPRGPPIAERLGHPTRSAIALDSRKLAFNQFNQENHLKTKSSYQRILTVHQSGASPHLTRLPSSASGTSVAITGIPG